MDHIIATESYFRFLPLLLVTILFISLLMPCIYMTSSLFPGCLTMYLYSLQQMRFCSWLRPLHYSNTNNKTWSITMTRMNDCAWVLSRFFYMILYYVPPKLHMCVFLFSFLNKTWSCMVYVECISVIWWVVCTLHRLSTAKTRYGSFTSPPTEIPVYDCQNWLFIADEATVNLVASGFSPEGSLEACFVICWISGRKKKSL